MQSKDLKELQQKQENTNKSKYQKDIEKAAQLAIKLFQEKMKKR